MNTIKVDSISQRETNDALTKKFESYYKNKKLVMREVFKHFISSFTSVNYSDSFFKGLEIGVNFGDESTKIWLEEVPDDYDFWLVDMWKPWNSQLDMDYAARYQQADLSVERAFFSTYLEVRKIELTRSNLNIHILRGDSKRTLRALNVNSFDFIYIDGDHKYETVLSDLTLSKNLINKKFGLICGDDLDCEITPERYLRSKQHPNQDLLQENDFSYHPGVLAAVHEVFPKASMLNSFWWIYCYDGQFVTSW